MPLILNGTTGVSGIDGSAGTPSYQGGDSNTGVFFPAADTIAFAEGGAEIARFDSSGNLGIGTSSVGANYKLSVNGTGNFYNGVAGLGRVFFGDPADSSGYIGIYRSTLGPSNSTTAGNGLNFASIDGYTFNTAPTVFGSQTERMRIDSNGNVGIGASPSARLTVSTANGRLNSTTQTNEVNFNVRADITKNCGITFTEDAIADRWTIGCVNADQSFIFRQNASSMTTGTERMRLTGAGDLLIGTTSSGGKLTILDGSININWANGYFNSLARGVTVIGGGYNDTTNKASITHVGGVGNNNNRCGWTAYSIKTNTVNNGAEYYIRPVIWNGSTFAEQGSAGVYLTDNATSWTSASDERLKENLQPIANAVEKVKTIRAVTGKYKADTDGTSRAFLIAQDVQAVLPEAVTENSEGYLGLAYTETIPLLVAAIKEQQAMIEELKQEVALLKGV